MYEQFYRSVSSPIRLNHRHHCLIILTHHPSTTTTPPIHPIVLSGRRQNKIAAVAKYGYWANPNLPTWKAVNQILLHMPLPQFLNLYKCNQTAFHNLCTQQTPPAGIEQLLWNGLKFCIEKPLPHPILKKTFKRLQADIRLKYFWKQQDEPDIGYYNKKLYIKSDFEAGESSPALKRL